MLREAKDGSARTEILVDLKSILSGKSKDIALQGNDILYIPTSVAKTAARRSIDTILQFALNAAIYNVRF